MHNFTLILLLSCFANAGLGLYVLKKRPHSRMHRRFAVLAFSIAAWVLSNALYQVWFGYPFTNASYAVGAFVPPFLLMWVSELTSQPLKKYWLWIMSVLAILFFILSFVPDLLITSLGSLRGFGFEAVPGPIFVPFFVYLLFFLLLSTAKLFSAWRKATGLRRVQFSYVLLAIMVPVAIIAIVDFFLPLLGVLWLVSFDALTSFVFLGLVTYSITRYRFLDIRVALRKGLVQLIGFVPIVAAYVYLVLVLQNQFSKQYALVRGGETTNSQLGIILSVIFIAFTIEPLRRLTTRIVNRLFFSKEIERSEIQAPSIAGSGDLRPLEQNVQKFIRAIGAVKVGILVANRKRGIWEYGDGTFALDLQSPLLQYFGIRKETLVTEEIPFIIEERPISEREILKRCDAQLRELGVDAVQPIKAVGGELLGLLLISKGRTRKPFSVGDVGVLDNVAKKLEPILVNILMYREFFESFATK